MPDPAEQLQKIYLAGFELKVFDRFPKCVGVVRDEWAIGVLVESGGRLVFQAKEETVEATRERLEALRRFREELQQLLMPASS